MNALNEALVTMVRGLTAFFTLLIFARILGKQQISQLTFFDYILGITIGSIAATLTTDLNTRVWPQWIGLFTWSGIVFLLHWISLKWRYASKILDGEPTVVIMNGQVMEDAMRKMHYRMSDLSEQLREKGAFNISEVEFAVLETSGKLSVLKKSQHQPVTPSDLKLPSVYVGLSTELIYDGVVIPQNLRSLNLTRKWLASHLSTLGIHDESEVFLASLDTGGKLYVDQYRDTVRKIIDISDYKGPN